MLMYIHIQGGPKKPGIHVGMWFSHPSAAVYILGVVLNPEPSLYRVNIKLV